MTKPAPPRVRAAMEAVQALRAEGLKKPMKSRNYAIMGVRNRVPPAMFAPSRGPSPKGLASMPPQDTPSPKNNATISGHGIREAILRTVRHAVMDRDNRTCVYCGDLATDLDHVIPANYGGKSAEENLVACCRWCNTLLSDRYFEDGLDGRQAYVQERLHDKVRRAKRRLSICADCGNLFQPGRPPATNLICETCVVIDRDILDIHGRIYQGESLVAIADEYNVVPEVLGDRLYGTRYRREREKLQTPEEMKNFLRGLREEPAEYMTGGE